MSIHYFSVDEATLCLPWLEEIFLRLGEVEKEIQQYNQKVAKLQRSGHRNGSTSVEESIEDEQKLMDFEEGTVRNLLKKIADRGILVRDYSVGLVDFLHKREDRDVYLCWLRGEESISFWYETNSGFANRQPL